MAKFHFKIRDGSYVREADYEIPDSKLKPPPYQMFDKRYEDPRELQKISRSRNSTTPATMGISLH